MALRTPKAPVIRTKIAAYMDLHDIDADRMATRMRMSRSAWYRRYKDPGLFSVAELERLEFITGLELIKDE